MPSHWLRTFKPSGKEQAPLPAHADVVVIGGGFSGVSTAYWLGKNGIKNVVVLEKAPSLAGGATGRNGGHLWPGIEKSFEEEAKFIGVEEASKLWKFSTYNLDIVEKFIKENNIQCELRINGSVVLAPNKEEWESIQKQYDFLKKNSLASDMELWDEKKCEREMKNKLFFGGLYTKKAAQLWPAQLVWGMAETSTAAGAKFFTSTEVLSVAKEGSLNIVKTANGNVKAKYVVYATNAYTSKLLPQVKELITPVRGQVLVSSPLPMKYPYGYLANDGYEYWVQQPDGRVVLGGMRWKSTDGMEVGKLDDTTVNQEVSKGLRDFLVALYPEHPDVSVEREWTGIMGFSKDGKPLVGPVPQTENTYMLAGFTGHGMPLIFGCGEAVAAMIYEKETGKKKVSDKFPTCLLPTRLIKTSKL